MTRPFEGETVMLPDKVTSDLVVRKLISLGYKKWVDNEGDSWKRIYICTNCKDLVISNMPDESTIPYQEILNYEEPKDTVYGTTSIDYEVEPKHKFKVGDKVKVISEHWLGKVGIIKDISELSIPYYIDIRTGFGIWKEEKDLELVESIKDRLRKFVRQAEIDAEHLAMSRMSRTNGGNKMELKNIKIKNLLEGKKQFEKERTNEEVERAKIEFRKAVDAINHIDRRIKEFEELKKPHLEVLELFKK